MGRVQWRNRQRRLGDDDVIADSILQLRVNWTCGRSSLVDSIILPFSSDISSDRFCQSRTSTSPIHPAYQVSRDRMFFFSLYCVLCLVIIIFFFFHSSQVVTMVRLRQRLRHPWQPLSQLSTFRLSGSLPFIYLLMCLFCLLAQLWFSFFLLVCVQLLSAVWLAAMGNNSKLPRSAAAKKAASRARSRSSGKMAAKSRSRSPASRTRRSSSRANSQPGRSRSGSSTGRRASSSKYVLLPLSLKRRLYYTLSTGGPKSRTISHVL